MIWVAIAFILHITEQLLIAGVIKMMNPIIYVALFYLCSTSFVILYQYIFRRKQGFFDWSKAAQHKFLVFGYAGGAAFGNAFWFASIFLIGLGMTSFILVFIRVFVTAYAYFYMQDRFAIDKTIAFAMSIILLFAFSFNGGADNIIGIITAFISCFGFTMESISQKKLAEHGVRSENMVMFRNGCLMILSWSALSAFVMLGHIPIDFITSVEQTSFILIVVAALLGGLVVNLLIFQALKTVKLSQLQAIQTTKPVFIGVLSIFILGEEMSATQILIGVLIVLTALYFLSPSKSQRGGPVRAP